MTETKTKFDVWAPKFMRLLMADFNFSVEDAAAFMGNSGHESNGFETLQEVSPTVKGSKGGWGINQWTGPRRRAAESYWARNGYDPSDMMANYKWLWMELSGKDGTNEHKIVAKVKAAVTLSEKVEVICYKYLRPGILHMNNRKAWANRAIRAYYRQEEQPEEPPVYKPGEVTYDPPVASNGESVMDTKLWGVVRHAVGAVGAFLVGMGWADADSFGNFMGQLDVLLGSVGTLAAFVASIWAKIRD